MPIATEFQNFWSSTRTNLFCRFCVGKPQEIHCHNRKTQTLLYIPVRERLCLERREVEKRIYGV